MSLTSSHTLNDRAAATPLAVLAQNGRSSRMAGRRLPRAVLAQAARSHAVCCATYGLADVSPDPAEAQASLTLPRQQVLAGQGGSPLPAAFAALHVRRVADHQVAALPVGTVLQDLGAVRLVDETALLRYVYKGPGTMGR